MSPSLRFALLAALILSALLLNLTSSPDHTSQDSSGHAAIRPAVSAPTCTTDTDCQQRFGGDGGPGR